MNNQFLEIKKMRVRLSSYFKYQLPSSNGVDCSEGAYTATYIDSDKISDNIKTEASLFYCAIPFHWKFGNKASGFQLSNGWWLWFGTLLISKFLILTFLISFSCSKMSQLVCCHYHTIHWNKRTQSPQTR